MIPASLKNTNLKHACPLSPDELLLLFHLKSGDSQKNSTLVRWTRGAKQPFKLTKLSHYAQKIAPMPDGSFLIVGSETNVATRIEGETLHPFVLPDPGDCG